MNNYQVYLASPRWQKLSAAARKRADYRCQLCNTKDQQLHVHHRTYQHLGKDEEWRDLVVLCERCHQLAHWAHTHTEQGVLVWRAVRILNKLFANMEGDFEKWLLAHVLSAIGTLYYLKTKDFCGANLALLETFLGHVKDADEVWKYAFTFTYGTEKELKALNVNRERVAKILTLFLNGTVERYREYYKLIGGKK